MVTTPGWLEFEGGGRDESLCEEPGPGGDGGPTDPGGPGDPGGGDCEPFAFSELNQSDIDQCYIDEACAGDPSCEHFCEDKYGAFRFGLNAASHGDPVPSYWLTPSSWVTPKGAVGVNSTCPGIITQRIHSDIPWGGIAGSVVTFEDISPATFASILGESNQFGQQFMDCLGASGGTTLGNFYFSRISAAYDGEVNSGISGVALLTDDGSNPTITGYGILIDRTDDTIKFVKWTNAHFDSYVVLDSAAYVPVANDEIAVRAQMRCVCPFDPGNPQYPSVGTITAQVRGSATIDLVQSGISQSEWASLGYGGLVGITVANMQELNAISYTTVVAGPIQAFHTGC